MKAPLLLALPESSMNAARKITAILWDGVDQIAARWKAVPAWVTVAMRPERGTYSAYYGLVSAIRNRRSIPMTLAGRSG